MQENTAIHGDYWHHNAAIFNKNDLAYKTVRATTSALGLMRGEVKSPAEVSIEYS